MSEKKTKSIYELEKLYQEFVKKSDAACFKLDDWIPSLSKYARPVVPGELVFIMSGTGVGKTMALQEIARRTKLQTLLFEMELPDVLTFERFVQGKHTKNGREVEATYKGGGTLDVSGMAHIRVCGSSSITFDGIVSEIEAAEIRPQLVLVDYLGLMKGEGKSRYEKVSNCAESLKRLAKETNTIVIAATQRHRPGGDGDTTTTQPELHDANGSGDIEMASDLMLGLWRDPDSPAEKGYVIILKNRKGNSGPHTCKELDIKGEYMQMFESENSQAFGRVDNYEAQQEIDGVGDLSNC